VHIPRKLGQFRDAGGRWPNGLFYFESQKHFALVQQNDRFAWRSSDLWNDNREYLTSCTLLIDVTVFVSMQVLATPNYLQMSQLQTICPLCGPEFNKAVTRMAQFGVGMVMVSNVDCSSYLSVKPL
jgi:hypothetical protein